MALFTPSYRRLGPVTALAVATALGWGCGKIPVDESASANPAAGVVRGTVFYQGPRPCSQDGHIVGAAVLLFFERDNPPPPAGVALTAVNFTVVTGDRLFVSEPRSRGPEVYCPPDGPQITVTAPFQVAPVSAGNFIVQAFYDRTGDFLPTFKIRNLPRQGDIGGGYLDTADAQKHAGDVNYQPKLLPIAIGLPDAAGRLTMPANGFVREDVVVTLGAKLPLPRPYFHLAGLEAPPGSGAALPTPGNPSGDPRYAPVLTFTQDHHLLAPPDPAKASDPIAAAATYQKSFPAITLKADVPAPEQAIARRGSEPFHFQTNSGLSLWRNGDQKIPEGQLPELYPLIVLSKLADDPEHTADPQSVVPQGDRVKPIVLLQGLTLFKGSISSTLFEDIPSSPSKGEPVDEVTTLVRPAAICLDATRPTAKGVLVSPFLKGKSADPDVRSDQPLFDPSSVLAHPTTGRLVQKVVQGCLPTGRYAVNAVYPTGQIWTTPNEAGACAAVEGATTPGNPAGNCEKQPRPVLFSQGPRAVVEIVPAQDPAHCAEFPVPDACVRNPSAGAP